MPLPTYNFNIMTSEILLKKSQLSTFIDLHKQAKKNRMREGDEEGVGDNAYTDGKQAGTRS